MDHPPAARDHAAGGRAAPAGPLRGSLGAAIAANIRFIVRWKKGTKLLDNWGTERKAWEIARGKRSQSYRLLRDPRTKQLIKVGVVAIPVTLRDHPQPLWLVVARLGGGREPWYLLSSDPIRTIADAWEVVEAYARRWQIELVWRASKSELAFESPRVEEWDVRQKLLLLATLAYAFLLHLLDPSFPLMSCARNCCVRGAIAPGHAIGRWPCRSIACARP